MLLAPLDALIHGLNILLEADRRSQTEKGLKTIDAQTEKGLARVFSAQARAMRAEFRSLSMPTDAMFTRIEKKTKKLFEQTLNTAIGKALLLGGNSLIEDLGLAESRISEASGDPPVGTVDYSFALKNPRAVDYLSTQGAGMVTRINESTRAEIRGTVQYAMETGTSYSRTAQAIQMQYRGYYRDGSYWNFDTARPQRHIASRAHLIAVTESGNAYMEGQLSVIHDLEDAKIPTEKKWSTMGDERVSAGCLANAAEGWIAGMDSFQSGHDRPLRFPGCRCDLLVRIKEEAGAEKTPVKTIKPTTPAGKSKGLTHRPSSAQQKLVTSNIEDEFRSYASVPSRNMTSAQAQKIAVENLQKLVDERTVSIRADSIAAKKIVKEGRFKTQFETNTSNGSLNSNWRATAENSGLGYPLDIAPVERPIYGYMSGGQGAMDVGGYGNIEFVLKNEVKKRTTVTVGDSLYNFGKDNTVGTPISKVGIEGIDHRIGVTVEGSWGQIEYIEAQIQGGVSTEDILQIIVHDNPSPAELDEIIARLGLENFNVIGAP